MEWLRETVFPWLRENETVLWCLGTLSVLTLVGSAFLLPALVTRMPADYFVAPAAPGSFRRRHPVVRILLHVAKNALGVVLFGAGLALLFLPGQGILTVLAALALLDFPGKRRLELKIVRLPRVLLAVNWLRGRAGRPPLVLP
jgi:hypothetical protein